MAKNKNRQQAKQQRPSAERGPEQPQGSSATRSDKIGSPVTPADIAHKGRRKRFGHN
jgi:hypothetical protein